MVTPATPQANLSVGAPYIITGGKNATVLDLRGNRFENTLHGLRKNATINLLEAGCTNSEAKAITGHSTDVMVNLYSKKVNQRRQPREAMDKVVQLKRVAESGD